jgi:predicted dienelactone hydrolase
LIHRLMPRVVKILLAVALVLIVAAVLLSSGRQPQPFGAGTRSAALLHPGPFGVSSYDEDFVDESRPTMVNGSYGGAPRRELEGSVLLPDDIAAAPYPLLVYSHGFSSTREGGAYLGRYLASLGYVTVAVDYPLTNYSAPGSPNVKDVVNQPADISFILDTLIAQSTQSDHRLYGMIDPHRVGAMGISLGGMTTMLAAFHPTMADSRIKAALSIAGPTAQFDPVFFRFRQLPFLMLATDTDALVPYPSNAARVPDVVPGSQLVTIKGASHTGFSGAAGALRWMHNPDRLGCYAVEKNLQTAMTDPWFDLLGTPEQGINDSAEFELCQMDPLPAAMNPLRQQMISKLVVAAFFQSQFATDVSERATAALFLGQTLASELDEVTYRNSQLK